MAIQELLNQFDMGDSDQAERQRRIAACLDALHTGCTVRGIVDGKVTVIFQIEYDHYVVYQRWVIADAPRTGGSADLVSDDPGADDILDDNFGGAQ